MNDQPGIPQQDNDTGPAAPDQDSPASEADDSTAKREFWPQFRRLLVFQIKLYIDALRDLILSPLSVVVFLLDLFQGNKGDRALFESLLQFGRKTERAINLFDQHDTDDAAE